jgi:uncharacterized UBP type Zn finger protein
MPRGIINSGNTCYFNCAVQSLFHVPQLTRRLRDAGYQGPCAVTREYARVVVELLRSDLQDAVDARALLAAFRKRFPRFDNTWQHDAAEAMVLLIDVLEESLGKEFMEHLFRGETTETITFLRPSAASACSARTLTAPFVSLPLSVSEPGFTLDELLEQEAEPSAVEDYEDGEGVRHPVAITATKVTTMPRCCIFVFKTAEEHFNVQLPLEWRGRRLQAFVVHQGANGRGHYVCAGRAKTAWWKKSDETVEVVDLDLVQLVNTPAYLAVYCEGGAKAPP